MEEGRQGGRGLDFRSSCQQFQPRGCYPVGGEEGKRPQCGCRDNWVPCGGEVRVKVGEWQAIELVGARRGCVSRSGTVPGEPMAGPWLGPGRGRELGLVTGFRFGPRGGADFLNGPRCGADFRFGPRGGSDFLIGPRCGADFRIGPRGGAGI